MLFRSSVIFLLVASSIGQFASAKTTTRPNVVLFLVDDMGWMDCGAYGSQYYETPHIDRLAKQSMRFTDAYACPLCSPTRASIMTGQYSSRHGITSATGHQPPQAPEASLLPDMASPNQPLIMPESRHYLEPSQYTLAEALRDAGYRTAHIGKWHLGLTKPHWPEAQGFETAFHCHPDPGPPGEYFSPYGVIAEGNPNGKNKIGTITDGPKGEYIVDRLTDEAINFVRANQSQAFFLNFWQYGVHGPWGHKEAFTAEFAKKKDPTKRQGNPIMGSMLRSVDESVGRLTQTLDELKLTDNTVFIFMSDNGGNTHSNTAGDKKRQGGAEKNVRLKDWQRWAGNQAPTSNAPLREGKGRLYEGGCRVPFMVRWPEKIPAGSTSNAIVGAIDVYPTILDLLGLALPSQQKIDGMSLLPVLKQTGKLKRDAYFTWFPHIAPGVIVRQGNWKLIRHFQERPGEYEGSHELFDLENDLSETTNLASKYPERVKELDALIDQFIAETKALAPKPNPNYKPIEPTPTSNDPIRGLVPKGCKAAIVSGALQVTREGNKAFLGTVQVKHASPVTLKLRMRSGTGGAGMIQWKFSDQAEFPDAGQTTEYPFTPGDQYHEVTIELPITSKLGTVRIYLPQGSLTTEFESIEFFDQATGKNLHRWKFSK
jgi:arylsulfatase A-like enzyme